MWFVEWIFWGLLVFVAYAYAGYPLALLVLSGFRNRPVLIGDIQPRVSFVITAYNEEARIKEKIENSLQQQYPLIASRLWWLPIVRPIGPTTLCDPMRPRVCALCAPRNEEGKKRPKSWRSARQAETFWCSQMSRRPCLLRVLPIS